MHECVESIGRIAGTIIGSHLVFECREMADMMYAALLIERTDWLGSQKLSAAGVHASKRNILVSGT